MNIKTNGFYRTKGKVFSDETCAGVTTGINYIYLKFYQDGRYSMVFRRDIKDLDFVEFLENTAGPGLHPVEQGHFEVEGDRIKFKIVVVYKDPNDPVIFYYTIINPDLLVSYEGEELDFFESSNSRE